MKKVAITTLVAQVREVQLPDVCPRCNVPLDQRLDYVATVERQRIDEPAGDPYDCTQTEVLGVVEVQCAYCGKTVAGGDS